MKQQSEQRKYLNHINDFRGIAIIYIVFSHCFNVNLARFIENKDFTLKLIMNLLQGGTTFFVFISGYLLYHIYFPIFNYKTFIIKKLKTILIPYIVISSFDILYFLSKYAIAFYTHSPKRFIYLTKIKSISLYNTYFFGHGEIPIGLWYIPFIMMIFLLTPLYLKFIHINQKLQVLIICFLLLISTLIHRTFNNSFAGIYQNVIYFSPVYLIGMYVCRNFEKLYEKLKGKKWFIIAVAISIAILQSRIEKIEEYQIKKAFNLAFFDLMLIQKIIFSIAIVVILKQFDNKRLRFLKILAENSFGIFFIHGICISFLTALSNKIEPHCYSTSITVFLISATIVLLISLAITLLIRYLLPSKSKFIIGC